LIKLLIVDKYRLSLYYLQGTTFYFFQKIQTREAVMETGILYCWNCNTRATICEEIFDSKGHLRNICLECAKKKEENEKK